MIYYPGVCTTALPAVLFFCAFLRALDGYRCYDVEEAFVIYPITRLISADDTAITTCQYMFTCLLLFCVISRAPDGYSFHDVEEAFVVDHMT
jgi:hypothetical protein